MELLREPAEQCFETPPRDHVVVKVDRSLRQGVDRCLILQELRHHEPPCENVGQPDVGKQIFAPHIPFRQCLDTIENDMRTTRKRRFERGSARCDQRNVRGLKRVPRVAVQQRHRQCIESKTKPIRFKFVARRTRGQRNNEQRVGFERVNRRGRIRSGSVQ